MGGYRRPMRADTGTIGKWEGCLLSATNSLLTVSHAPEMAWGRIGVELVEFEGEHHQPHSKGTVMEEPTKFPVLGDGGCWTKFWPVLLFEGYRKEDSTEHRGARTVMKVASSQE